VGAPVSPAQDGRGSAGVGGLVVSVVTVFALLVVIQWAINQYGDGRDVTTVIGDLVTRGADKFGDLVAAVRKGWAK
jgi:hypothetical protein